MAEELLIFEPGDRFGTVSAGGAARTWTVNSAGMPQVDDWIRLEPGPPAAGPPLGVWRKLRGYRRGDRVLMRGRDGATRTAVIESVTDSGGSASWETP